MKSILYIIALVAIAAAGYFTYSNIAPHQEQLNLTDNLEKTNADLRGSIKSLVGEISTQKTEKEAEQSKKNELNSEIELTKTKINNLAKQSDDLNGDLDGLKEEKADIDRLIAEVKKAAGDVGVTVEKVPEYLEEIEGEKKQLNQTHNSLLAEVERYTGDVKGKKNEVVALQTAETKRRQNLKANGVSSLITAVDNDWGFVIVKPHSDALIKQDSQLIVVRGTRHVGRLSINAIENGRVLANIDYNSLVSGMRIRPGDRVILGKVVTR